MEEGGDIDMDGAGAGATAATAHAGLADGSAPADAAPVSVGVNNGMADGDSGDEGAGTANGVGADVAQTTEVLTGVAADGDEVVAEMPVFVSQELSQNLFLLQYPLRPAFRQPSKAAAARMKPIHHHLELDFPVPGGEHVDPDAEGGANVPKVTYASTPVVHQTHQMIGVMRDGALYLTPVKGTLQMRPQFGYLDEHAAKQVEEEDGEQESKSRSKTSSGPTKLQTQIKRRESRRAVAARENSYLTKMEILSNEQAVDMKVFTPEDPQTVALRERLGVAPPTAVDTMAAGEYIELFAPPDVPAIDGPAGEETQLTLQQLATKPVEVQVREIMKRAHALTFAQVCSCVSRASSPTAILTALKAVARMVLGCWVLKSELYAKDRAVHVRDHILIQVMADDDHCVSRLDVCEQTRSRRADATNILKGVCVLVPERRKWQFKLEPDHAFIAEHPALVAQQEAEWSTIATNVARFFEEELAAPPADDVMFY